MGSARASSGAQSTNLCQFIWQYWPLLLGNVLEWYDFGIYSFLAPDIEKVFFHSSSISTWAGYTVTFLLRPFGGFLNGWLADKYGRRTAVLISILGMLLATFGQGVLPTYLCCGDGWGTLGLVFLLLLRALQGLSAGGELGPIVAYIGESAPPNRARAACGLLLASAGLGFLLANLLVTVVVRSLTPQAVVVGFSATGALAVCYYSALWCHGCRGRWCPSYLKSQGMDQTLALLASCAFTGTVMISWVVWPVLNDLFCSFDPLIIMLAGGAILSVCSFPLFLLISSSVSFDALPIVWLAAFGLLVGFAGSHAYIFCADLFPVQLRALGFGMSCNLAFAVLGGTAPLIDAAILDATHWAPGVGLYWALMSLMTTLVMAISVLWRRSGHLPSHLLQKVQCEPNWMHFVLHGSGQVAVCKEECNLLVHFLMPGQSLPGRYRDQL
ncbi:unnamed protein product [Durusdinium trenchii]|uniref:Major facilitator superfamily (MFS) profile domain-containing protein n=1 Tax=Durusdinium trenchii TaxID=1381693 RepID=A0ABP0QZ81_9DINO